MHQTSGFAEVNGARLYYEMAGIAGARKVVIPGVAHMVNMEEPEVFNRIVLEFLEGVDK